MGLAWWRSSKVCKLCFSGQGFAGLDRSRLGLQPDAFVSLSAAGASWPGTLPRLTANHLWNKKERICLGGKETSFSSCSSFPDGCKGSEPLCTLGLKGPSGCSVALHVRDAAREGAGRLPVPGPRSSLAF